MEHAAACFHRSLASLECIEDHLWRSTGSRTLQELSGAFALLERTLRSPGLMLEDHEAWNLLDQIDRAFVQALTYLPADLGRTAILAGFAAARNLIASACPMGDTQGIDPASLPDERARLRVFRNLLENARLQAEVEERAADRRDALLVELASLVGLRDASAPVHSRRVAR